jgi:hypothetical protein
MTLNATSSSSDGVRKLAVMILPSKSKGIVINFPPLSLTITHCVPPTSLATIIHSSTIMMRVPKRFILGDAPAVYDSTKSEEGHLIRRSRRWTDRLRHVVSENAYVMSSTEGWKKERKKKIRKEHFVYRRLPPPQHPHSIATAPHSNSAQTHTSHR